MDILRYFPEPPATLTLQALANRMGVGPAHWDEVLQQIHTLLDRGKLRVVDKKNYGRIYDHQSSAPQFLEVEGRLEIFEKGGACVLTDNGERYPLDPQSLKGALHRDRVRIQIERDRLGRTHIELLSIIDRETREFSGVWRSLPKRGAVIHPQDLRLPEQIAATSDLPVQDGDLVAARFVDFGDVKREPSAEVIRVFGHHLEGSDYVEAALYNLGLRLQFPQNVVQLAEQVRRDAPEKTRQLLKDKRRADLRHRAYLTIDPESARDFDDAVFAEEMHQGWRLSVAIADVSEFVEDGSPIDQEAEARGTSVYFPDRVLPMLPEALSNDLCSLRPDEPRLAMVADLYINFEGELQHVEICEAVIESHGRLTYDHVARMLGLRTPGDQPEILEDAKDEALRPVLQILLNCTRALRHFRRHRGHLDLDLGEPQIQFDTNGHICNICPALRHEGHQMIEEAMIAANEAVALWFYERDYPCIYRTHPGPNDFSAFTLMRDLGRLGLPSETLSNPTAARFTKYLKRREGHPLYLIIARMILRTVGRATYTAQPLPHYGVGAEHYLHFTSPIRRYPDLMVHRLLKAHLRRQRTSPKNLEALAQACNGHERTAVEAERHIMEIYKALYAGSHKGEQREATVLSVWPQGLQLLVPELFIEGWMYFEDMPGDFWIYDDRTRSCQGERTHRSIETGDVIEAEILDVDLESGEIFFGPVEPDLKGRKRRRG